MVVVNTGAALYVSGLVPTIRDGAALARESIDTGRAEAKLQELIAATQRFGEKS
jgi:anthranilate phosphoribosyltransferase